MIKAIDAAFYFQSKEYDTFVWRMTPLKIQKLIYYAQALNLVRYGRNLFSEKFYAWVHGPVCREVYDFYKGKDFCKNDILPIRRICSDVKYTEQDEEVLQAVYKNFGMFSGEQLESFTHQEAPWVEARGNLKAWEDGNTEITTDSIARYYCR